MSEGRKWAQPCIAQGCIIWSEEELTLIIEALGNLGKLCDGLDDKKAAPVANQMFNNLIKATHKVHGDCSTKEKADQFFGETADAKEREMMAALANPRGVLAGTTLGSHQNGLCSEQGTFFLSTQPPTPIRSRINHTCPLFFPLCSSPENVFAFQGRLLILSPLDTQKVF